LARTAKTNALRDRCCKIPKLKASAKSRDALVTLRVIKIENSGLAGLNSGKAAEFRYLLPPSKNGAAEDDDGELDL
jgi:hypothetical protein